jgi:molybdopterin/thiamine biosynthesis adenylyltransferase
MELFDADKFDTPVTVIGAGATGSWLVLQLAKLGITNITVYDFDVVEAHNIPNQAYNQLEISDKGNCLGKSKVEALEDLVYLATGTSIKAINEPFVDQRVAGYVFLMVDSMAARKSIFDASIRLKRNVKLLVEPRMGLDVGRVYNVDPMDLKQVESYEACWYSDDEAEVSACGTSMTVITTAMVIAGWCARQLINHVAGEELDNEILIDLKYNNIVTTKW